MGILDVLDILEPKYMGKTREQWLGGTFCPICLRTNKWIYSYTCVDCHAEMHTNKGTNKLWKLACRSVYKGLAEGYGFVESGITFDEINWDQHWEIVKRRLDAGTETRLIECEYGKYPIGI